MGAACEVTTSEELEPPKSVLRLEHFCRALGKKCLSWCLTRGMAQRALKGESAI